jgi:hypothetical protein
MSNIIDRLLNKTKNYNTQQWTLSAIASKYEKLRWEKSENPKYLCVTHR